MRKMRWATLLVLVLVFMLFMLGMLAENSLDWGTVAIRDTNLDGWLTFLRDCERTYLADE